MESIYERIETGDNKMIKLEITECMMMLQMIEVSTFQGKDILVISKLIEKLQKEAEKLSKREEMKKKEV